MQLAKRTLIALAALVIIAVDFAAMNEITTGNEPSHAIEWVWLSSSSMFFAALGWACVRRRRCKSA